MKQTAVEWLEKIRHGQKGQPFDDYEWEIAFNHAKEMEKEQIIDAYDEGYGIRDAYGDCFDNQIAEQYYNQIYDEFLTFKSEEE
jgi:hypothetical protein